MLDAGRAKTQMVRKLKELSVPMTVRYLAHHVFNNYKPIKCVNICCVKDIGAYAFADSGLKKILTVTRTD